MHRPEPAVTRPRQGPVPADACRGAGARGAIERRVTSARAWPRRQEASGNWSTAPRELLPQPGEVPDERHMIGDAHHQNEQGEGDEPVAGEVRALDLQRAGKIETEERQVPAPEHREGDDDEGGEGQVAG